MFYTNEVGRSFLASFILVMDFSIVMQVSKIFYSFIILKQNFMASVLSLKGMQ